MSGYPGTLDIDVTQGETFEDQWTWRIAGTPVNVTGYTATLTVRTRASATDAIATLTVGSGLTLGGAAGTISVLIAKEVTAAYPVGSHEWDIFVYSGAGKATPFLRGRFTVRQAVTRV